MRGVRQNFSLIKISTCGLDNKSNAKHLGLPVPLSADQFTFILLYVSTMMLLPFAKRLDACIFHPRLHSPHNFRWMPTSRRPKSKFSSQGTKHNHRFAYNSFTKKSICTVSVDMLLKEVVSTKLCWGRQNDLNYNSSMMAIGDRMSNEKPDWSKQQRMQLFHLSFLLLCALPARVQAPLGRRREREARRRCRWSFCERRNMRNRRTRALYRVERGR